MERKPSHYLNKFQNLLVLKQFFNREYLSKSFERLKSQYTPRELIFADITEFTKKIQNGLAKN